MKMQTISVEFLLCQRAQQQKDHCHLEILPESDGFACEIEDPAGYSPTFSPYTAGIQAGLHFAVSRLSNQLLI